MDIVLINSSDFVIRGLESLYHSNNVARALVCNLSCRPYVIYDRKENPSYISGILVVAQNHIAVHYDFHAKQALIDIPALFRMIA